MMQMKAIIYGDSIMKGTVLNEAMRYHATANLYLERLRERFNICAQSRARFGMTIDKGQQLLEKDIAEGLACDCALLEFGGNDCDYPWEAIAKEPVGAYGPNTPMERFMAIYKEMIAKLRAISVRPLLMTLPPIDAGRYLDFVSRDAQGRANILAYLGDVQHIYHTQERYSDAVRDIAACTRTPIVDVRSYFLERRDLPGLLCRDGIHPGPAGYALILQAFVDFIMA